MATAVCLVSGGLDSCVCAGEARQAGLELAFFHASYGQRTQSRELSAFHAIADFYSVQRRLVADLHLLSQIGGSALTDPRIMLPEGALDREGVPASYVPFRNAVLLAAATGWAEVLGAHCLYIGAVSEDGSDYPDCRRLFFEAFQRAIDAGTRERTRLELRTPLIGLRKADIVRRGLELGAPLQLTWSCYRDAELACGRCDSCLFRLRGFAEAGHLDPIPYRILEQARTY